jgi:hypothetical protein
MAVCILQHEMRCSIQSFLDARIIDCELLLRAGHVAVDRPFRLCFAFAIADSGAIGSQ